MFAGSCIGVICLVISLEFLRRVQREYDGYIRRQHQSMRSVAPASESRSLSSGGTGLIDDDDDSKQADSNIQQRRIHPTGCHISRTTILKRQFIRAMIHTVQFAVAYFIMLLAMYYNGDELHNHDFFIVLIRFIGYIIMCIIIGAFFGSFIFSWDQMPSGYACCSVRAVSHTEFLPRCRASARNDTVDVTGCCG